MMVNKELFRGGFIWCTDKDFQTLSQEVKKKSIINNLLWKQSILFHFH